MRMLLLLLPCGRLLRMACMLRRPLPHHRRVLLVLLVLLPRLLLHVVVVVVRQWHRTRGRMRTRSVAAATATFASAAASGRVARLYRVERGEDGVVVKVVHLFWLEF
jgi:hypothetical protein